MGVTGSLAANRGAAKADLIIGIGTRYSDFTTSSKWAFQREDVSFLNLNVNGADGAKLGGEALIADAKEGLKEPHQELSRVGYQAGYEDRELADLKARGTARWTACTRRASGRLVSDKSPWRHQ